MVDTVGRLVSPPLNVEEVCAAFIHSRIHARVSRPSSFQGFFDEAVCSAEVSALLLVLAGRDCSGFQAYPCLVNCL